MHQYTGNYSWKYKRGTVITFLCIQTDHGMGILWSVLVFPSDSTFSMRLPDSASIFTAEIWAIIKALENIKNVSASKFIIFTDSLSCLQALLYTKLEHPLIGMAIRKCVFLNIANKNVIYAGYPAMLASGVMKRQIQLPSLLWICLVPRLAYPTLI